MKKFQKKITNPMTLIAMFATLSETSAAVTLPFLDDDERDLYVWFLISFPFYLLLLFFATLNFNYRSLYAPSDFDDEKHFVKATDHAEDSENNIAKRQFGESLSSTSMNGATSVTSPCNAQGPPVEITLEATHCAPNHIQLPEEAKELHIVDVRGTSKKAEVSELLESIRVPQDKAAQVIMFITCTESENLLKASVLKHLKQKTRGNTTYPVVYNLYSQRLAVIDPG